MKARFLGLLVLAPLLLPSAFPAEEPASDPWAFVVAGFHEFPGTASGSSLFGGTVTGTIPAIGAVAIDAPDLDAVMEGARADPRVRYVELTSKNEAPPPFIPNDPQWNTDGNWGVRRMDTHLAWDATRGSDDVVVAVVDTGLNAHEDIDPSRVVAGYDFWYDDAAPDDPCDHGTPVSSVIGATLNNGKGISGLAQVRMMPLKIYGDVGGGSCGGSSFDLARALIHAADHNVTIASAQWQGRFSHQFANDSIKYAYDKGMVIVGSAGNWGPCESCVTRTWADNPDKVIVAAAIDQNANRAYFSSVGPEVDVTAPGVGVVSASSSCTTCYTWFSGTSLSAPMTSGVVALMWSANPWATRDQITQRLLATADDVGAPGFDHEHGHGRVDAGRAVISRSTAFDADFDNVGGNNWWVQTHVHANHPVKTVQARAGEGNWRSLNLQSWGGWAASFNIPTGSKLQLRATDDVNVTDLSGCYTWPAGTSLPCSNVTMPVNFTHGGGNGWWVEAVVDPKPARVLARDTNGPWVELTFREWQEWAGSFKIEAGNRVQFQALYADGRVVESCWFSHPAGASECLTPFDATFSNVRGNEWWIETDVTATGGTLSKVEARVNNSAWNTLVLQGWGSWAKNMNAPAGSLVEFRATASDGRTELSERYTWPPS